MKTNLIYSQVFPISKTIFMQLEPIEKQLKILEGVDEDLLLKDLKQLDKYNAAIHGRLNDLKQVTSDEDLMNDAESRDEVSSMEITCWLQW